MPEATFAAAFGEISDFFENHVEDLLNTLNDLMEELATEGEGRMIEILESAVTPTGYARAMAGGAPGRIETGTMRDAIGKDVQHGHDEIVAEWGWLQEVLDYFLLQEGGSEVFGVQFEGMNALRGSYIEMREKMRERLEGMK
jgi:hypothetical protein